MARTRKAVEPEAESKKEDKPAKTAPISKPKKFLKKSIDAIQRIARSKQDKIFLLDAVRAEDKWTFTVMGTKGTQYHTRTSTTISCTIMDFKLKKKPCKHVYFIVTQVAQNDKILENFRESAHISKSAYAVLDKQLTDRLKSRMDQSKGKEIDLKDDTDCVICFTEMEKDNEALEDCSTCKKYFHSQCICPARTHQLRSTVGLCIII